MRLVEVSENILINPDRISAVERKQVRGKEVLRVIIDGESIPVEKDPEAFFKSLELSVTKSYSQHWSL